MGLPVSDQIIKRLESEDRTASREKTREKSKDRRARTSQLQREKGKDAAEEKKRISKNRKQTRVGIN